MEDISMLLVKSEVLPDVFIGVVKAKRLLATGEARNATEAARLSGISRSAFYKYKDSVFCYNNRTMGRIINIHALLNDKPGVLSALIGRLSGAGANILTLNQSIPTGGRAPVTVSARVDELAVSIDHLFNTLREIDGVIAIEQVAGE